MRRPNLGCTFLFAGLVALSSSALMAGAGGQPKDPPEDDLTAALEELAQAAQEEKELQAQGLVPDRGYESTLNGTYVVSQPMGTNRPDVVGEFQVTGYAYAFHIKVLDPTGTGSALVNKLASMNGQKVTLAGKLRNKSTQYPSGQYFIVSEVMTQSGGTHVPTKGSTVPGRL